MNNEEKKMFNNEFSIKILAKKRINRFSPQTPVIAKRTSAGWVPSAGEGIQKHAQQFLKQAGGVLLQ